MKKIGVYGGTFDPVHFGHLNLAFEMREKCGLDEILFCPTGINPHKLHHTSIESIHRLEMLRLALEDIPFFKISEIELNDSSKPSYTIDTLCALQAKEQEIYLILGKDSVQRFDEWKDPYGILELATLIVGSRQIQDFNFPKDPELAKIIKKSFIETKNLDISATEVRNRVKQGLYIRHLVPSKVVDYIYENKLYF